MCKDIDGTDDAKTTETKEVVAQTLGYKDRLKDLHNFTSTVMDFIVEIRSCSELTGRERMQATALNWDWAKYKEMSL